MQTIFAWIFLPVMLLAAYGWSAWLVGRGSRMLVLSVTLALGAGGLTLVMFWLSLLGVPLNGVSVTALYLGLMLPGWWLWKKRSLTPNLSPTHVAGRPWLRMLAGIALAIIAAAVLFNAAYWPFSRDDAIGIYHAQAQEIAAMRALLPLTGADSLYLAYPPLMPLTYAYTYLLAGWENEYLARALPALMSLGVLAAAYALARQMRGALAGWLAALLLALTPTFGRWASAGYVDLPMAFYYTLAAVFALRLWESRRWRDALLAGLMMGLAAWTKNAALIGVALLGAWLLWALLWRRIDLRLTLVCAGACAAVAAPWYIRNLLGAGFLIPDTAWTEDARQSVENLLIFITHPEIYGLSGWLFLAGFAASVARFLSQPRERAGDALLLLWTIPFFLMWWLFASYDPRFLLHILPLFAVMAGNVIADLWERVPAGWQPGLARAGGALLIVLTASTVWNSIEYKDEILRAPLMSDAEKHIIVGREAE